MVVCQEKHALGTTQLTTIVTNTPTPIICFYPLHSRHLYIQRSM